MSRYVDRLDRAAELYDRHGWETRRTESGLAFVCSRFDVLEAKPVLGALLHRQLITRCPTATVRPYLGGILPLTNESMRWLLFLAPGSADPDAVAAQGGILHSGPDALVPAPPSRLSDGRIARWVVPPLQARFKPYKAVTVMGELKLGVDAPRSMLS